MPYYSKKMINFREFVESSGAFVSDQQTTSSYDGRLHPQISLEFPTEEKHGEVIGVRVQGANYCFHINGGTTVCIPRKIYHKKYNRLPRHKTKDRPGDMVTAVFYKYKPDHEKDHRLKSFQIHHVR